jgi:hypothetical protein
MKRTKVMKRLIVVALLLCLVLSNGAITSADPLFEDFDEVTIDDVISNSTTFTPTTTSNVIVEFIDNTWDNNGVVLASFDKDGYVDQDYTITPPAKVGKHTYIGNNNVITGSYSDVNDVVIELYYANLTIMIGARGPEGEILDEFILDGLDFGDYYIDQKDYVIPGYVPKGDLITGEPVVVEVILSRDLTIFAFYFDYVEESEASTPSDPPASSGSSSGTGGSSVPKTADVNYSPALTYFVLMGTFGVLAVAVMRRRKAENN